MAIATKDMGSVKTLAGTLKVMLYYDDTTISSSSHIPSAEESFIEIGDLTESLESEFGYMEIGGLAIKIKDNYENYVGGVWYKIFQGSETQFRFYLDQGAGDTFYFWGYLPQQTSGVNFNELYVSNPGSTGKYIRVASINLLSLQKKIMDASVASFATTMYGVSENLTVDVTRYMSVRRLFSSFIKNGIGTTGYDIDLSVVMASSGNAFEYYNSATGWKNINDLYFIYSYNSNKNIWFNNDFGAESVWEKRYSKCSDLMKLLSFGFGVIPVYWYDIANSRHMITLQERGRSGNALVFNGMEMKPSSVQLFNLKKQKSVKTIRTYDSTDFSAKNPESQSYDLEMLIDFHAVPITTTGIEWWEVLFIVVGSTVYDIQKVRYYDQVSGSMVEGEATPTILNTLVNARKYYDSAFSEKKVKNISRTYKAISASDDGGSTYKHTVVKPGCRTQIHDGVSNLYYYANRIVKSTKKNEMKLEWIGE